MKKLITTLLALLWFASATPAEEHNSLRVGDLEIGLMEKTDCGCKSCGCCFYYPKGEKNEGMIVLDFEYDKNAEIIINGKKEVLEINSLEGDDNTYVNRFSNNQTSVDVLSHAIDKSPYSSRYFSTITVRSAGAFEEIVTYGECGC